MGQEHIDAPGVNLNTGTPEEIRSIPQLSAEQKEILLANRPFKDWDEVAALEGFDLELTQKLVRGGVRLQARSHNPAA